MTAFISAATSSAGVLAYQDHRDKQQFWYIPGRVDLALGQTLSDFRVDYWGFGGIYRADVPNLGIRSVCGAILSGTAVFDISDSQRKTILERIRSEFGVTNPRLAPMRLTDVKVTPVLAKTTLHLASDADVNFPTEIGIGESFNYVVGTGGALFANVVAAQTAGTTLRVRPKSS